ncbi:pitrilysin family protein [Bdellovibrionota bacterium FG-2]
MFSPRFKKTVFSNGLTLVSERHSEFRSLSIGVWVKAGTRHEKSMEAGISHFLEHMLFKGTDNRTPLQIAREVDEVGGDFNAFTTREYTCFHILMLAEDLELGLDILGDVILNSNFDAEELERERKVIVQEISMAEESPEELGHDILFELVYGAHGLGRPILGTTTSVKRIRRAALLRFFRKHYRPDQMIIAVAGDVSHEKIKKYLRSLCRSRWPGRAPRVSQKELGFEPAPVTRSGNWWITRPTEQVHLLWGVKAPHYASRDRYALSLLNVYLGGGMSSVLFQEIREKNGLAYTVYSNLSLFLDSGYFSVYAATAPHKVALCLKLIEECLDKLQRQLLTEEELHVVKSNLRGSVLLSSDSVESRMSSIAKGEIYMGTHLHVDELCAKIDAVSAQDIRRVARKLFRDGKKSILALGPKPGKQVRAKLKPTFPKKYRV